MRIFFSLSAFILLTLNTSAQIKMGLRVSPQLTWATADNKSTSSNGSRVNVAYGIMLDYYFSENYALGTELCVNTYGVNLNLSKDKYTGIDFADPLLKDVTANSDDIKYDYQLQYFQIPILLKMRTKEIGYLRYYAEFGFGAGFLFKARANITTPTESLKNVNVNHPDESDKYTIQPTAYSDKVNVFRGAMVVGAGIQYNLHGNSLLVMGLRYDNGLSSFTSDERWSTALNYIAFNFGLLF